MEQAVISRQIREYLLIISLPDWLRHRVEKCRQHLLDKYAIGQPSPGRPHVPLLRFTATEPVAEKIVFRLREVLMAERPFLIELAGYGGYPMHAMFIRIANQPKVRELIRRLGVLRALMKLSGDKPHFMNDPNVALAGRIQRDKYLAAMKEYEQRHFSARFVADACLLLGRSSKQRPFQVMACFCFEALPGGVEQGMLFGH